METLNTTGEFSRKEEHHKLMRDGGCDIPRLIAFRRDIHQHAELAFKEVRTNGKIRELLAAYGIEESCIKACAGTGMTVDIEGTGPEVAGSGVNSIALRADMDALPIPEHNPTLSYKTTTDCAHMCGHDGHMATLLAAAEVLMKNRDKIPKGKKVRLLFQPAEEGPGGALPMIKEGCLTGIDEVYGFHNIPNFDEGDIRVVDGPIMAKATIVKIRVVG
jgi:amidohydrolase